MAAHSLERMKSKTSKIINEAEKAANSLSRRGFISRALVVSAGAAVSAKAAETGQTKGGDAKPGRVVPCSKGTMPTGKIGNLTGSLSDNIL
jgi:hypothetical protein